MRHILQAIAIIALALLPVDDAGPQPTTSAMPAETTGFIKALSKLILFDIECARLAATRTRDPRVRNFATVLLSDRRRADESFRSLLAREQLPVPDDQLGRRHRGLLERLRQEDSKEFDRAFIDAQRAELDETIGLVERYAEVGDDEALKSFAEARLPVLRRQADMLRQLD